MGEGPTVLGLGECHDAGLVGGKAINLAHLVGAGFPVPDGFVVTTEAFRRAAGSGEVPAKVRAEILDAYRRMGSPGVAVRSSATAEDLAAASMAGQYETFLDVSGEAELLDAVRRCWAALDSPRTRAYLAEHGIDPAGVAMAVVVQRMAPADAAGVLFTANPRTGSREEMLLEASWGLGEVVVSGKVQPDTLILDRATGAVKSCTIGDKAVWVEPGSRAERPVPEDRRRAACLSHGDIGNLWRLGLRVMEHFGAAQDIEWAIGGGKLHLLQSRAITTLETAEAYERRLQETRAALRQWKHEGRGDWVRHNIGETLPHPTPLAWSVIRRFMSGGGGFGAMYRAVGFEPSEAVAREGFLELVGGRVYMDLSRAGGMFFEDFPFRYDLGLLRTNPDAAQGPPTVPAGSLRARLRVGRKLRGIQLRLEGLAADFDRQLDARIIPDFLRWVGEEKDRDLEALGAKEWVDLWRARERRVMDDFGPQSLLPSLIAAMAMERLREFLREHFWDDNPASPHYAEAGPEELANVLAAGAEPDLTLRANVGLYDVASGRGSLEKWLGAYGHRAPEEFDLATPRWRERPESVRTMAAHLSGGASPAAMHERRAAESARCAEGLAARLSGRARDEFQRRLGLVRRYMRFREDGKHYLMMGYDLLRDLALEAGRRLGIGEDVFLLELEELHDALSTGFAPLHLLEQRRMSRGAEARLSLPDVITGAEIDSLGEPPPIVGCDRCAAFPLSSGVAAGPARIVFSPAEAGDLGREYVLVCPSSDPNWTPLFVNAAALVMEMGGSLSHGAVVAREMGIPAVVLSGATKRFRDGEPLVVDGTSGAVSRAEVVVVGRGAPRPTQTAQGLAVDPHDTRIPYCQRPPVPGARERAGGMLRNVFLLVWGAYLVAAFALPAAWLYRPTMAALDAALWPLVAAFGKAGAVAVLAGGLAVITMAGQRLLTDNQRLRVAKARAARLRAEAGGLPADSPRRQALLALAGLRPGVAGLRPGGAGPVHTRVFLAALVPIAVILGPMVMSFMWLPQRVDPASWNPRPGATAYVTAMVDGDYLKPVTLTADSGLVLEAVTPASQSNKPVRATLEELLASWQKMAKGSPPERVGRGAPRPTLAEDSPPDAVMVADLTEYLKGQIPAQGISWTLRTPEDRPGRFAVSLAADGAEQVRTRLVLGDRWPPESKEDLGDGKGPVQTARPAGMGSPIRLVKVKYVEAKTQGADVFWAPLAVFGRPDWDAGWLSLYLVVYLPMMFLCRWLFGIA